MKVVLLASWYPSASDPIHGVFVRDQAVVMARHFDVAVVAPSVGRTSRSDGGPAREEGVLVYRPHARARVPGSTDSALEAWGRAARRGVSDLAERWGRPDVIHSHVVLPAGWAAIAVGESLSVPVVLTEHLSRFDPSATAPRQLEKVRMALGRSSALVAVGPHLRDEMLAFSPDISIDVLGDLVRTDLFTPAVAQDDDVCRFLGVGLLTEKKGFADLIRATSILRDSGVERFEVVIAGDGPLRGALEAAARGLPISFTGNLSRQELLGWMRSSRALVSPSLRESFGLVMGEAMACGKPVIATASGGAEFLLTPETGLLVPVGDADQMASAMRRVASGEARFDAATVRRSVEERFGEEAFIRGLSAIYTRVAAAAR